MNANLYAQSGDFEFLFESTATDGTELEGWANFGADGSIAVSSGVMSYTYGTSTSGFQLNPPTTNIYLEKANFPYLAIKLSATPSVRRYMYLKTNGTGAWYKNKANPEADTELDPQNIYYYDISGDNFTTSALDDGLIERLIFNLEDASETSVDVEWIKTFASVQAIKDYVASLSINDVVKSQTKIISGENKIDILKCELNAKVQIFDLLGKQLHSSVTTSSNVSIPLNNKGICIVKIIGETTVLTNKIVLK